MERKEKKTTKIRSLINLNVGFIVLGFVVIYLFINMVFYFTSEKTAYYEVVEGSNSEDLDSSYVGIALRDESIHTARHTGFIDYYVSEGSRVSKNTTLYSIDSNGNLNKLLSEATSNDTKLNADNLSTISDLINDFCSSYQDMDFTQVYSFKTSLKGTVVDLVNMNKLQKLAKKRGETFSINKSAGAGIVMYRIDNYESIKKKQLKKSLFNQSKYVSAQFSSGDRVEKGSPIYKTINNEEWSIAIPLTKQQAKKYKKVNGVKIKFLKDDVTTTANMEVVRGADKKKYGIITLSKYMVRYAQDRFLDIQIIDDKTTGLKIPKSSLVKKNLYAIPKQYGAEGGDGKEIGFNRQIRSEGSIKNEFYYPTIAYMDDHNYYVSTTLFDVGEILLSLESNGTQYSIGKTQEFVGVYSINNGYTSFVRVNILETLDEYYIVESGTPYGLAQYDRIVLDGSKVSENQIIYQ